MKMPWLVLALVLLTPTSLAWGQGNGEETFLRSRGYGWIAAVNDEGEVTFYQETEGSLLFLTAGFVDEDVLFITAEVDDEGDPIFFPFATVRIEEETVVLEQFDQTVVTFDPIEALPERPISGPSDDPEATFEVFWQVIEENYAFFPLTGVDWQAAYDTYRPQVTPATSDEELFDVLVEMAAPLRDGHMTLSAPDLDREVEGRPPSPSLWMLERGAEFVSVIGSYLDPDSVRVTGNNKVIYGTIDNTIGYLNVLSFSEFGSLDERIEETVFDQALDQALTDLAAVSALIVDIRFNTGGTDRLSVALARRFTDRVRLGYSKQARIGGYDEFAEATDIEFGPRGVQYLDRPVLVLTSNNTVSAADVAAMMLRQLPNVLLLGETTAGSFSNILPAVLPNGWDFSLSNERVFSPEDPPRNYEFSGIPPHIPVAGSEALLDQGRDNVLERAVAELDPDTTATCQATPTVLCLNDSRFAVEVEWRDFNDNRGPARVVPFQSQDSGLLWFFAPANWEMLIKVLDACALNDHFWVFAAATTTVEYTLRVTDTKTGGVREYKNPLGNAAAALTDTGAFASCP